MKGRKIEYELIKTYEDEKARVRVWKPILTEEERALRMSVLIKAAEDILKEQIKIQRRKGGL